MIFPRRILPLLLLLVLPACDGGAKNATPPPAAEKPKSEAELAFTTLSPKAALSLKIQTQLARIEEVQDYLVLPGWIMAAPGHEVTVTAPAAGYVRLASELGRVPAIGENVGPEQELFRLEPVLTPGEQIQIAALKRGVESDWAKAKISLKAAQSEWQNMKDLVDQNLRGKQELIQSQKTLDHAKEELAAATDKQKLFDQPPQAIRAPRAGKVLAVHVSPGQYVAAAAPLATLIDLSSAWLRVPVPEFELPQIEDGQPALVQVKKTPGAEKGAAALLFLKAKAVGRSPHVEVGKHSVELHYELADLPNPSPAWSKDQLVNVQVALNRRQRETVVPASALVFDIHGSAWIYLDRTPDKAPSHRYQRRRVELGAGLPEGIVIRPSLGANDLVVTQGAAALFSREFYFPPGQPPQDVDDD